MGNRIKPMKDINKEIENKFILDACCGGRMFWFNKKHPNTLYVDNRVARRGHCKQRPNHTVEPDQVVDFRDMPFSDGSFKLVVFDPPYLMKLGDNSILAKHYGKLNKETWKEDIRKGFDECYRVLEEKGVLIFKWGERDISIKEVLGLFPIEPLFGHQVRGKAKTHWLCFMKLPEETK